MRRKIKFAPRRQPDLTYQSESVARLINYVMERGKRGTASRIVYQALDRAAAELKRPALEALEAAINNVAPTVELRSRRVGGANYQIPFEVSAARRLTLALKWMIEAAVARRGKPMAERLAEELVAATKNEGEAIRRRENVHKMAEANRAFAHFARSATRPRQPVLPRTVK